MRNTTSMRFECHYWLLVIYKAERHTVENNWTHKIRYNNRDFGLCGVTKFEKGWFSHFCGISSSSGKKKFKRQGSTVQYSVPVALFDLKKFDIGIVTY